MISLGRAIDIKATFCKLQQLLEAKRGVRELSDVEETTLAEVKGQTGPFEQGFNIATEMRREASVSIDASSVGVTRPATEINDFFRFWDRRCVQAWLASASALR